jgi:hypothetical protein
MEEKSWFNYQQEQEVFSFPRRPDELLCPHASHSEGAADSFPRVKRLVDAAEDSPSSTVQVMNKYSSTSKPHNPEWRGQAELGLALSLSDQSLA